MAKRKPTPDELRAARVERHRKSGRRIEVILRDPAALAELERLVEETGSARAAIETALRERA